MLAGLASIQPIPPRTNLLPFVPPPFVKAQDRPVFARVPVFIPSIIPESIEPIHIPKAKPPKPPDLTLLARARKHMGKNPTGWARVWCARFIAVIAPEVARKVPNPNLARSYLRLPKAKPAVGVIVVLRRGSDPRSGHIGIVSGFDRRGNPRVVSGNHNRRVGEAVYPKSRVLAYVRA